MVELHRWRVCDQWGYPVWFMMLELGIVLVIYVVYEGKYVVFNHILKKNTDTLSRQVFEVLDEDIRKGNFMFLTYFDKIKISLSNEEIERF